MKTKLKKPLRSAKLENNLDIIKALSIHNTYLIGSPKIDGIRCVLNNNQCYTKSMKIHPNEHIKSILNELPYSFDGELTCKNITDFNDLKSQILSKDTKPDFIYNVFDIYNDKDTIYSERISNLKDTRTNNPHISLVETKKLYTLDDILSYEKSCLDQGYEGIMLRIPNGIYKYGDSTFNEGYLYKLKRFKDSEAKILEVIESTSNTNKASKDSTGNTHRSSHKANIINTGSLGAFKVIDIYTGWIFTVKARCSQELKDLIWNQKDKYIGEIISYKYQEIGSKNAPRLPIMLHFRDKIDLDLSVDKPYL